MSSSESEDENLKQLMEAADTSLFNDAMFREPHADDSVLPEPADKNDVPAPTERPKSNRYLNEEESVFQSDLNVTESMKKFIGKKLSTLIAESIAFVEVEPIKGKLRGASDSSGVKLLRGFEESLNVSCGDGADVPVAKPPKPIKRRVLEDDSDASGKKMMEQAAYDVDALSKSTVGWSNRPKSKLYEYRQAGKGKVPTLLMSDEFSATRNKNSWEDSKIKAFPKNR
uniref:Uncharacterized protein n=1 Tax=Culex tarsalis TaxID=7177 RepID=A0A1Q3F7F8_CULTA